MIVFDLVETDAVLTVDLEPYAINGSLTGEMSTLLVSLNGEQINRWPKLGPWHRSERHGAKIVGLPT